MFIDDFDREIQCEELEDYEARQEDVQEELGGA